MLKNHPYYKELLNDIKQSIVQDQLQFLFLNRKSIINGFTAGYTEHLSDQGKSASEEDITFLAKDVNLIINDIFGPDYP